MADFHIGFVIFPGITQLDFTGPFEVLSRIGTPPSISVASKFDGARVHVIAKSLEPVLSDRGLAIMPSSTFSEAPALDVICVSGGAGTPDAMADRETTDFIRRQGLNAKYVTSVCTGAFLLGAAGLLNGRRATTHWACVDLLPLVGASPKAGRFVQDGNVITTAGVSAGIDFALKIVAELAGAQVAQAIQLGIEYDPAPPFDAGSPDNAPVAAKELMISRNQNMRTDLRRMLMD